MSSTDILLERLELIMKHEGGEADEVWPIASLHSELQNPHAILYLLSREGTLLKWEPEMSNGCSDEFCATLSAFSFFRKTDQNSADLLFVSTLEKGKGAGSTFLKRVFEQLKQENINELLLEVRPSNKRALRAYEKLGFLQINTRPSYYSNGEEARVLKLVLT